MESARTYPGLHLATRTRTPGVVVRPHLAHPQEVGRRDAAVGCARDNRVEHITEVHEQHHRSRKALVVSEFIPSPPHKFKQLVCTPSRHSVRSSRSCYGKNPGGTTNKV
eukprot:1689579-Rhodomonas_salina.1